MNLRIIVAHLNHRLRGKKSDEDEAFVDSLSKKYGFECIIERANVAELQKKQKLSLEDAGRQARYTFFYRLKEAYNASSIFLAHHRDDNVETMLLNLIRGAGVNGLCGMEITAKNIIRPLIDFSKEELQQYCKQKKLKFREDKTNADITFRRNYVRHVIIPALEKINPRFREMLHIKSYYFEEIQHLLILLSLDYIKKYCKIGTKEISCKIQSFRKLLPAIQRSVVQLIYEIFHGSTQNLTFEQVEELIHIVYKARTGAEKFLGNRLSLTISYGKAIFQRELEKEEEVLPEKKLALPIPGMLTYSGGKIITRFKKSLPKNFKKNRIYISTKDKNTALYVRRFQPGDRIQPFGMNGSKKIQDLFTDEKIPRKIRNTVPIIIDQKDKIVAVWKLRIDRSYHPKMLPGFIVEIEFKEE